MITVKLIQALKADLPENCDVLKLPLDTSRPVDILCPPESLDTVKDHFSRYIIYLIYTG